MAKATFHHSSMEADKGNNFALNSPKLNPEISKQNWSLKFLTEMQNQSRYNKHKFFIVGCYWFCFVFLDNIAPN